MGKGDARLVGPRGWRGAEAWFDHPGDYPTAPPSAIRHPPSAIRHPPSAIRHPPSAIRHPPSAIRHPPSANAGGAASAFLISIPTACRRIRSAHVGISPDSARGPADTTRSSLPTFGTSSSGSQMCPAPLDPPRSVSKTEPSESRKKTRSKGVRRSPRISSAPCRSGRRRRRSCGKGAFATETAMDRPDACSRARARCRRPRAVGPPGRGRFHARRTRPRSCRGGRSAAIPASPRRTKPHVMLRAWPGRTGRWPGSGPRPSIGGSEGTTRTFPSRRGKCQTPGAALNRSDRGVRSGIAGLRLGDLALRAGLALQVPLARA